METSAIDKALDELCAVFDDELERQENVLRLCILQGEAAVAHDADELEMRTKALVTLIDEAGEAEARRHALLHEVVGHFDLSVERQTLSGLIEVVPEPWSHRMAEFQREIQAVLNATRKVVRDNNRLMRRSMRAVDGWLNTLIGTGERAPRPYSPQGAESNPQSSWPALIDAQG